MSPPSTPSNGSTPKPSGSEENEVRFMADYAWRTLIALYERLKLSERLRLRNVDRDIVVGGVVAEALKAIEVLGELSDTVRSVLRRLQAVVVEEVSVEREAVRGRVLVGLAARYWPTALPVVRTRLVLETPANLLLVATLVEVRNMIARALDRLPRSPAPELGPLRDLAAERLERLVSLCDYLLSEPVLRPLVARARLLAEDERRVMDLEERVREDALRRPREYRAYARLLELRKRLRQELRVVERDSKELGEVLSLRITKDKLYEVYGFTLVLECLVDLLGGEGWEARVDREGRVLVFKRLGERVAVSYNAFPQSVESRLRRARYYGIIDGEVKADKLGGRPDTIIVRRWGGERRLLIVDYKYTRDLRYLVDSRFKAYSYLYEFNADCAVIVAPRPKEVTDMDEEVYEQRGFYLGVVPYGGAIIEIDDNGKMLALVYVDPEPGSVEGAKRALTRVLKVSLF